MQAAKQAMEIPLQEQVESAKVFGSARTRLITDKDWRYFGAHTLGHTYAPDTLPSWEKALMKAMATALFIAGRGKTDGTLRVVS